MFVRQILVLNSIENLETMAFRSSKFLEIKFLFEITPPPPSHPHPPRNIFKKDVNFRNNVDVFVVHRGRNIPTLSSINPESNLKEKQPEPVAAGKPSNWNDSRNKSQLTGGGRRSRRNSFSDESQVINLYASGRLCSSSRRSILLAKLFSFRQ